MENVQKEIMYACKKVSKLLSTSFDRADLDERANDIFKESLNKYNIISEENPEIIDNKSDILISLDPLDGSQNLNVNVTVGSIFGVFINNKIVAAGYAVYGFSTLFVWAETTVSIYKLEGEFYSNVKKNVLIPYSGKTYSINEGNQNLWDELTYHYITKMRNETRSIRWASCMVTDLHRILMEGGVFMYPTDSKNIHGKLRLLYEAIPMAFIFEKAGGFSCHALGKCSILENITFPKDIHKKVGVIIGGQREKEMISN